MWESDFKASVVQTKNYEFLQFFLRGQPYWLRGIWETSKGKSTTKTFSASPWFVHFDGLCNYLHLLQKHPAPNFFENKSCFPDQERIGYYINKFSSSSSCSSGGGVSSSGSSCVVVVLVVLADSISSCVVVVVIGGHSDWGP